MKQIFPLLYLFLFSFEIFAQNSSGDRILGEWMSPKKDLLVECFKENNLYYSKVIWFKRYNSPTPDDPNGVPESQWLNAIVMDKFAFQKNQWKNGKIWDLKNGKRYPAYIQMIGTDTLKVTGYKFINMFNESIYFYRYKGVRLKGNE